MKAEECDPRVVETYLLVPLLKGEPPPHCATLYKVTEVCQHIGLNLSVNGCLYGSPVMNQLLVQGVPCLSPMMLG